MFTNNDRPHRRGFFALLRQKKTVLYVAAIFFIVYVFYNLYFLSVLSMEQRAKLVFEPPKREQQTYAPVKAAPESVVDEPIRHNERKYRGVLLQELQKYLPDLNGMFTCMINGDKINHTLLNDDYCDCLDNTDEPGTNACRDSVFYCDYQPIHKDSITKYSIPSSRVNDGICDCCDGSDEWASVDSQYELLGRLQIHGKLKCHNVCLK